MHLQIKSHTQKSKVNMIRHTLAALLMGTSLLTVSAQDIAFECSERDGQKYYLTAQVPDGNYRVTVVLGSRKHAGNTTVRGESRRLFLENVPTRKKETRTMTFTLNKRKIRYVQLDKETNSLMYRDVATVNFEEKLQEVDKIKDIGLGIAQKEALVSGKPVELEVGDQKVVVGVDLREPVGFKVMNGDMEEWKRQQAIRYDDAHEGYMGYVQTDENRWEYRHVVDRLRHEESIRLTEREKADRKEDKKRGLSL